jgi:Fe-S-cluster containining protein
MCGVRRGSRGMSYQDPHTAADWFEEYDPAGPGLRFACTMCGNCCTGPEGYVLYTEEEGRAIAARLGITVEEFVRDYTKETILGRSLREKRSAYGLDCVFLDRESAPGKAVCGIYEDRPEQCRTWPFWKSLVQSRRNWEAAKRTCPGLDRGRLTPPQQIRVLRDKVDR